MATPSHKNEPRTIFGWCMYDWANSAYVTTAVGLLPIFFASSVVHDGAATIWGYRLRADTLWGFTVGLAGVASFAMAPVLGAIADFSARKKHFLLGFAYSGALFCVLLYFCRSGDVLRTLLFFLLSQIGFVNANVFYDAFLPHITSDEKMDSVSARGYAFGYLGGGLQFALALALIALHERHGLTKEHAARIGIAMSGLWWAGFTLVFARLVKEDSAVEDPLGFRKKSWFGVLRLGVERVAATAGRVRQYKHLVLFLAAFMFYNEGIQTVINMATIYGTRELNLSATSLMLTLLVIQFVATAGSFLFSKIAAVIGTRRAIITTLLVWSGVVCYAYFINSTREFFILGVVVGIAMGGSQSLSRSYYGSMIPEEGSAEFFGFYTVFTKFSAIWGPWAFALITHITDSARTAIASLVFFFAVGLVLLSLLDEKKARSARELGFR